MRSCEREVALKTSHTGARRLRWALPLAAALACAGTSRATRAQTATDAAWERLEAIDTLRVGVLRPSGALALRQGAGADSDPSAAVGFGFALAALEKRGAAWEAIRLDGVRIWPGDGVDVAFTALDLAQAMIGTDADRDVCLAALPVIFLGDCQHGGQLGFRAQLLQHAYDSESKRWFHRWFELGAVVSLFGDSFDVDFVRARLPITLGVSLDHVANITLPASESKVHLRGIASLGGIVRLADYRLELSGAVDYRPSFAPFDAADDYAVAAHAKFAYVWLSSLFGELRSSVQRIYLEVRADHWEKPWLADRPFGGRESYQITAGFELSLRSVTPS